MAGVLGGAYKAKFHGFNGSTIGHGMKLVLCSQTNEKNQKQFLVALTKSLCYCSMTLLCISSRIRWLFLFP